LTERDEVKNNLKRALENSNCIIINVKKYKAIPDLPGKLQDWIKYINATLGTKKISNIEKISFFTHDKYAKTLDQKDKSKIRTLIDFYDKLKLSSREPAGFEASVPITIDEKLYIFDKGNLIPVSDNTLKDHSISGPPKTAEEKTIDKLRNEAIQYKEGGLEQLALKEEIEKKKRIEDLKIAMGKYRADSLEAKVLKEEIDKLGRQ
jgi:hypothetical protein